MSAPPTPIVPLNILYPNGSVEGVQIFVWSTSLNQPVLWDGTITAGTITIGTVNQGTGGSSPWLVKSGLGIGLYDYVSYTSGSTTDTYVFKTGGSGGTTIATVVITYTDSTKAIMDHVTKT